MAPGEDDAARVCDSGAVDGAEHLPKANAATSSTGDRVVLTTYPGQAGVSPIPLEWNAPSAVARGPVVASRRHDTVKARNAIGAHGGSYAVYHALAVACGDLAPDHRPDYALTEPMAAIGPHPQWSASDSSGVPLIVSLDPWGASVQSAFADAIGRGTDVRPTIAVTKAHMRIPELGRGTFRVDGSIVLDEAGELAVTKAAIEPVWYLPGVAARFGVGEKALRRALFEHTGGMYPELITRPDMRAFLPPIGGATVYVFGPPERLADPRYRLTLRVHDECNGSDVFCSDICTCRPYLIHGIRLCVAAAQAGGVGAIVYFRKEGRALGEVTKFLVYNARKRQAGGDTAATYFARTESVAGVRDMRFQALMPDVLHWLGIKRVHEMVSMSNMKHDAIVAAGIPIDVRVPIPEEMLPPDSRVEIEAKIASGYFSGAADAPADLSAVRGRTWDDIAH